MKRTRITAAIGIAIGVAAGSALLLGSPALQAGIADSKHNLGTGQSNTAFNQLSSGTDEICVFCHTPHGANTSQPLAPLWNKTIPTTAYTPYASTPTLDGTAEVKGVSLACLSCHDGTQAIDNVINAPGSGGMSGSTGTGGTPTGWTWENNASSLSGTTTAATFASGAAPNLGTDISNDHPIGIAYAGGLSSGTDWTATGQYKDSGFNALDCDGASGTAPCYVDSGSSASSRDKNDMIMYENTSGDVSVECASCHDPHTSTTLFLRHTSGNGGSATCLACHNK